VFLTTSMLYYFDRWIETNKARFWVVSLILAALALLIKFTAIFFAVPMAYLAWKKWGKAMIKQPLLFLYGPLVLTPFFLWRWHISHYPEGIPAYTWLFNGNGIRFKGAWWWWLFAERIGKLILGVWGIVLVSLGLIRNGRLPKESRYPWLFHFWALGLLIYLIIFATGNVQHDYYQIILVPILCVFMALGADWLLSKSQEFHKTAARLLLVVVVVFMLMFGWYQARDFFNINHPEIVEAGADFGRIISNSNVKVIAPYGGDTAFLYQTGRRGWPLMEGSIDDMIGKGADYYLSTNFDGPTQDILQIADKVEKGVDQKHHFKVIKQTDKYVIIQLVSDRLLPKP